MFLDRHRTFALPLALFLAGCDSHDPVVEGRTLEEWLLRLDSQDAAVRRAALLRIARFGTAADSAVAAIAVRLRDSSDGSERRAAASALMAISNRTATDAITELMADSRTSPEAFADAAIAAAALLPPADLDARLDAASPARLAALLIADETFSAVLPAGERRRAVLLRLADGDGDLDPRARDALIRRLATLGADGGDAVPFIERALTEGRSTDACLDTLARIGSRDAARIVVKRLEGMAPSQRAAGMASLGGFLAGSPEGAAVARRALQNWLADGVATETRRAACNVLGTFGTQDDLPALCAHLDDPDIAHDARDATQAMLARDAVPAAAVFACWTESAIRTDAARARTLIRALAGTDRAPDAAAGSLTVLADRRPELREAALDALADLATRSPRDACLAAGAILADPDLARGGELAKAWTRRLEAAPPSVRIETVLRVALAKPAPPWSAVLVAALDAGANGGDIALRDRVDALALVLAESPSPAARAAALTRLAHDAPERAVVTITVGTDQWPTRVVLGDAEDFLEAGEQPRLHVLPERTRAAGDTRPGAPVAWLDGTGARTSRERARFILTPPVGAAFPPDAEITADAAMLSEL